MRFGRIADKGDNAREAFGILLGNGGEAQEQPSNLHGRNIRPHNKPLLRSPLERFAPSSDRIYISLIRRINRGAAERQAVMLPKLLRLLPVFLLILVGCGPDPQVEYEQTRSALETGLSIMQAQPNIKEVMLRRNGERRLNGVVAVSGADAGAADDYPPNLPEAEILEREAVDREGFHALYCSHGHERDLPYMANQRVHCLHNGRLD